MSRPTNSLQSDEDPLCCCEYVNEKGERSHILAFCCDCDALDDSCERLIQRKNMPDGRMKEICSIFLDRLRIPWKNGARRLEVDTLLPLIIIPLILKLGTIGPVSTAFAFLLVPVIIIVLKRWMLSKIPRTKFYFSFTLSSFFYSFLIFELVVMNYWEITHPEYVVSVSLLCLTLFTVHKTRIGSRQDESLVTSKMPGFCYCKTCQYYIEGRDHHCVWLNCCIGRSNRKWFLGTLSFGALYTLYSINLTLTTICYPKYLFNRFFLVPYSCLGLYDSFRSSLCFVYAVYAFLVLVLILAILGHQMRLVWKGVSYLEWRYQLRQKTQNVHTT